MRQISRNQFTSSKGNTIEAINTGSLQRIADATELMAKNFTALQDEVAMYKNYYHRACEREKKLQGTNAALKAWITRLKNKLAKYTWKV